VGPTTGLQVCEKSRLHRDSIPATVQPVTSLTPPTAETFLLISNRIDKFMGLVTNCAAFCCNQFWNLISGKFRNCILSKTT
jgi:hypothetical protein